VSLALTSQANLDSRTRVKRGNLPVSLFLFLLLLLSLAAVAADQFFTPVLYTSSPLWALAICAVLVWRRGLAGSPASPGEATFEFGFLRVGLFLVAHVVLVAVALRSRFAWASGAISATGWALAALKLVVLAPPLLLLPLKAWAKVLRTYAPELVAAAIVLFTFFPGRVLNAIWPQYVQALGRSVFWIAGLFVPGLTYSGWLTPTIAGPSLDLTIIRACSGLSGIELFDCLFAFIAILDWNRLRKWRMALAYFAGVAVMIVGNALRLVFLIVLGNCGFARQVARFHISAGWLFFSAVFLVYLAAVYRSLLRERQPNTVTA
jgi:exosortase/archaeosortase family protein